MSSIAQVFSDSRKHDTYLHAGKPSKIGWPHDHTAEDTFAVPPMGIGAPPWMPVPPFAPGLILQHPPCEQLAKPKPPVVELEYRAEFGTDGSARLLLITTATIAKFDTFADAQLAAKAINEHKGY